MDAYEQLGGEVHVVCGERVAPLKADDTIAQMAGSRLCVAAR